MADKTAIVSENVSGKFYVDENCIDCDACRATAPDNFEANVEAGYSYVFKQPENDEELALCIDAMEGCPADSIGDDAEDA